MATKNTEIKIKPLVFERAQITIVGETSLMTNRFGHNAKLGIKGNPYEDDIITTKTKGKIIPFNDMIEAAYWLTEPPQKGMTNEEAEQNFVEAVKNGARFGFPLAGIKQSIISGAYRAGLDVKMTELRGAFFLEGATEYATPDLVEIVSPPPQLREDIGRNSGMTRAPKFCYRPEFMPWEIPLIIKYPKNGKYTLEQLLNLVNYGGFVTGIGEWRPERDGQHGMFSLKVD